MPRSRHRDPSAGPRHTSSAAVRAFLAGVRRIRVGASERLVLRLRAPQNKQEAVCLFCGEPLPAGKHAWRTTQPPYLWTCDPCATRLDDTEKPR